MVPVVLSLGLSLGQDAISIRLLWCITGMSSLSGKEFTMGQRCDDNACAHRLFHFLEDYILNEYLSQFCNDKQCHLTQLRMI